MLAVEVKNKEYIIYESRREANSLGIKYKRWQEAEEGDYVLSSNDYVVPLIRKRIIRKRTNQSKGRIYERRSESLTLELLFPKRRFIAHIPKEGIEKSGKIFKYEMREKDIEVREIYEQTGIRLTQRKMMFGLLIAAGYLPEQAINLVHKDSHARRNNRRIKDYLYCPQTQQYIHNLMKNNMLTLRQELEKRGINTETIAERIVKMLDDKEESSVIRKWAFEQVSKAFEEKETIRDPDYLPQTINLEGLKQTLLLKARESA